MNADSRTNGNQNPWRHAAWSILPWIFPAALAIYLKFRVMTTPWTHSGYLLVSRGMRMRPNSFNLLQKLSFYRADLLVGFLIVPFALFLLARCLPRRWRVPVMSLLSLAVGVALFLQLLAYDLTGEFLSLHVYSAAIGWLREDPAVFFDYVNPNFLLVALGAALVALMGRMRWRRIPRAKRPHFPPGLHAAARTSATLALILLLSLTSAAWAARMPRTPFHQSVLLWAGRALLSPSDVNTREYERLSASELEARYREITDSPPATHDGMYWGKAAGCNVLIYVMETAPAQVLPADGDLSDFPNLARLRQNSFVGESHFTPFSSSHQAIFSILNSWYPSSAAAAAEVNHPEFGVPGMMRTLAGLGYDTQSFSPIDFKGEPDSAMYRAAGFQAQNYPDPGPTPITFAANSARHRMSLDMAALQMLEAGIERDLSQSRHFAFMIAPEVSHAPWADLSASGNQHDLRKRGRLLLSLQDAWIGQIMAMLQRHGQLGNTIIVVTGDHGIRDHAEDPILLPGTIDDYSFHVPLILFAPKALTQTVRIPWLTSHIDIAPSILDLLGVPQSREFEQGTPIWNPALANRTTYFLVNSFLGIDGYYSQGRFYMWSRFTDTVYAANDRMSFLPTDQVPQGSAVYRDVTSSVSRIVALDQVWDDRFFVGQTASRPK